MTLTDVASTVVAGSPADVFAALVDGRSRTIWVPPTGVTGRVEWFDARPVVMTVHRGDPAGCRLNRSSSG